MKPITKSYAQKGIIMEKIEKRIKKKTTMRLLSLMLLLLLVLLTACGSNDAPPEGSDGADTNVSDNQPAGSGDENTDDPAENPDDDNSAGDPAGGQNGQNGQNGDVAHPTYVPSKEVRTTDDGNLLVIVNKEYAVSPDYYPTDMVDIDGSLSTNQNLKVKKEAYDAYLKMLHDAQAEGLNFCICSAYRSYSLQESLYNNSLAANGQEYTEKMFAYPGKSEHHTGYAIDVTSASMNWGLAQNFTDYPDGAWITEHCSEYGFIIRYPKGKEDVTGYVYEPWHIRYVGVDVAKYITQQGITFEEYLGVA